jgi:hypothetical protein
MRKRLQVIAASWFLPIILERPGTGDVCGEGICEVGLVDSKEVQAEMERWLPHQF